MFTILHEEGHRQVRTVGITELTGLQLQKKFSTITRCKNERNNTRFATT